MSKESELLAILDDLEQRCQSKNEFTILGIAGLLQKLLYGDFPLLEILAQSHGVVLRFTVNNAAPNGVSSSTFWSLGAAYHPGSSPVSNRLNMVLGKNQFLCHRAMIVNSARYTVMDILRTVALTTAPLQLGVTKSMYDEARNKLDKSLFGGHLAEGLALLQACARIVLEASGPLRAQLHAG